METVVAIFFGWAIGLVVTVVGSTLTSGFAVWGALGVVSGIGAAWVNVRASERR